MKFRKASLKLFGVLNRHRLLSKTDYTVSSGGIAIAQLCLAGDLEQSCSEYNSSSSKIRSNFDFVSIILR